MPPERGDARAPHLRASRPALELLESVGHGVASVSFAEVAARSRRPRSTLVRLLNELVALDLVARVRRDDYSTPRKATHALLLVEPNAYYRSLLATDDALKLRRVAGYAYACLPVRRTLDFELPRALPVLPLSEDLLRAHSAYPNAARAVVKADGRGTSVRFPSDAAEQDDAVERRFPTLSPADALALLAAPAEPRLVRAVRNAAPRFDLDPKAVLEAGRRFVVEEPPLGAYGRNSLVLPRWLQDFAKSAGKLHARRFLHETATEGEPR